MRTAVGAIGGYSPRGMLVPPTLSPSQPFLFFEIQTYMLYSGPIFLTLVCLYTVSVSLEKKRAL